MLRTTLRELAAGVSIEAPETIEDPDVLAHIQSVLSVANAVKR